jgi:hypothetical protein
MGQENPEGWEVRKPGTYEIVLELEQPADIESLLARILVCHKDDIFAPEMLALSASRDGEDYRLVQVKACPVFPNTRHDAFVDCVLFDGLDKLLPEGTRFVRISYSSPHKTALDRIILNP